MGPNRRAATSARRSRARLALIRVLVVATAVLGAHYIGWRWLFSVNWSTWYIAVPLVLAETYSYIDGLLFGFTMWRLRQRGAAPPPPDDATVDVFITTYNEPLEMVMATATAAQAIRYPHHTWILDDGDRAELQQAAHEAGIGYITRSADWKDRPRHAKAGNLNNALFQTNGEFMLILDADQIPDPGILDKTLGWFRDEMVGLVQTPQYFTNVSEADPLGSQAPLFYGPIQQGKDGWNAAFFCGSNAVLRREALMQIGVVGYVREVEDAVRDALRASDKILGAAFRDLPADDRAMAAALQSVRAAVAQARKDLNRGEPVSEVTYRFQQAVQAASRSALAADLAAMHADLAEIRADLAEIQGSAVERDSELGVLVLDEQALDALSEQGLSPLAALEQVTALIRAVDVSLADEAQPIMPMATISVTEDMATAMRLHAHGWHTVYHHEVLARGLAPEDFGTMLHQRLRWSQGTLQVLLRENPLTQRGLTLPQRLMYLATMWSYLSGFAAVVYIAAPILFMIAGILPVTSFSTDFFARLVPFLIVNQLLFIVVGWGIRTWRGQQYSLALFPLWIRACVTAIGNVWFGRSLGFVVTPKTRQQTTTAWRLIRPQLLAMGLLVAAAVVGVVRMIIGAEDVLSVAVNLFWIAFDLLVLSVVITAVRYRGFAEASPDPETGGAMRVI